MMNTLLRRAPSGQKRVGRTEMEEGQGSDKLAYNKCNAERNFSTGLLQCAAFSGSRAQQRVGASCQPRGQDVTLSCELRL